MLHGIIYARHARGLDHDRGHDFADEVWSYFASGTGLQELYVSPDLLSSADWDLLAEAARWARSNAAILRDSHWIGGDPARDEIYGWAAWMPAGAVLTLRLKDTSAAERITYLKESSWNPDMLLEGTNRIAALTFCDVPIEPAAAAPPR